MFLYKQVYFDWWPPPPFPSYWLDLIENIYLRSINLYMIFFELFKLELNSNKSNVMIV